MEIRDGYLRSGASDGFTMISDDVIDGLEVPLTPLAFRIFCYLRKLSNKGGQAFPSYATMREKLGLGSDSTIKKGLDELVERGLLHVENRIRPGKKERTSNLYTTFPRPSANAGYIKLLQKKKGVGSTEIVEQIEVEGSTEIVEPFYKNCRTVLQKLENRSTKTVGELNPLNQTHLNDTQLMGGGGFAAPSPQAAYGGKLLVEGNTIQEPPLHQKQAKVKSVDNKKHKGNHTATTQPVKPKVIKEKYGDNGNVLLTQYEYNKLLNEHGNAVFMEYIGRVDLYLESTGKKYKNHAATISDWIRRDNQKFNPSAGQAGPKTNRFNNFEQREHDFELYKKLERAYRNENIDEISGTKS